MKQLACRVSCVLALSTISGFSAFAQSIVSAHSGVLHYSEGDVFIGDKQVDAQFGTFPDIKENGQLRTGQGRAEVLLTPGVFLRVGENSGIRMITNRLIDTRVEFVSGAVMVEVDDPLKDNSVALVYKDYTVQLKKHGLYGFESEPPQLKVYNGEAEVTTDGNTVLVKEGKLLPFTSALVAEKFDNKEGDALWRWSKRRSEYVSVANLSAAKYVKDSGTSTWNTGGWYYNPYYSMFTYLPGRGTFYSPFGYSFWSPYSIYNVYIPRQAYYGNSNYGGSGMGYNTAPMSAGNHSGVMAASSSTGRSSGSIASSGGAASAGASHSSGGSVGGGGAGHAGGHGR
ncbi:MAG: hypothetical protein ACR2I2_03765 [Bryobacteraceae bacterium]